MKKSIKIKPMTQIEKNKTLAEYLNIDFDKLPFTQQLDWGYDWNNLMNVAIKLKDDTEFNHDFTFYHYQLSFSKEDLFDNCFHGVQEINKYNQEN